MIMGRYIVTYTSMVIEAGDEMEAIDHAMESSGGHWEVEDASWAAQ